MNENFENNDFMDQKYIEDHQIVVRYSRGQLTPEESIVFEIYLLDKPELIEQLELERLLIKHLPQVDFSQQQKKSAVSWWPSSIVILQLITRWLSAPIGASVTTAAVCVMLFSGFWQLSAPAQWAGQISAKVDMIFVAPMRSSDRRNNNAVATLAQSKKSELTMLVIQPSNVVATSFDVRIVSQQSGAIIVKQTKVQTQGMGDVVLSVPSTLLTAGLWDIELTPTNSNQEKEVLVLEVIAIKQ